MCAHIYGAHAMNEDGKEHSGMLLTMRQGDMMNVSNKIGPVTVSSTETEVVSDGE